MSNQIKKHRRDSHTVNIQSNTVMDFAIIFHAIIIKKSLCSVSQCLHDIAHPTRLDADKILLNFLRFENPKQPNIRQC